MRKTIITCDFCGKEIDTDKLGKTWRTITWHGLIEMSKDVCGECWDERLRNIKGGQAERAKARSKTFPGIAKAMAEQWG